MCSCWYVGRACRLSSLCTTVQQLSRLGVAAGHAGRSRDAKPGTSHQEEVTAILHAAINLCSLTLLLFDSECKGLRHVYVYAKYGDVKKRKSRACITCENRPGLSFSFSTYAFNCRRAQLRTELREKAWFRGYGYYTATPFYKLTRDQHTARAR